MPVKKGRGGKINLEHGTPARNFAANRTGRRTKVNWEKPARRSKRR